MTIREIRDLALKVLGIYYLSKALIYAPQFASLFFYPEVAGNEIAIALSALLPLSFWLLIGLLLTFRTGLVAAVLWSSREEESQTSTASKPSLRFWIVLVGFFYLIGSLGGTVSQLWMFAANQEMQSFVSYYQSIPELMTLVLSIFCITKARAIEAFLMTKIGKDRQQTPGGDSSTRATS